MSIVGRQYSCAACGAEMTGDVEFEVLIDDRVRYVAVCHGHSTRIAADAEPPVEERAA